jgi:hypothetical protein
VSAMLKVSAVLRACKPGCHSAAAASEGVNKIDTSCCKAVHGLHATAIVLVAFALGIPSVLQAASYCERLCG